MFCDSMPLKIKVSRGNGWNDAGTINPGDRSGSLLDNKPGVKTHYIFKCSPDDSLSRVFRTRDGATIEEGDIRMLMDTGILEVVAELRRGQSYELQITTGTTDATVKFEHE